MYMEDSGVFKKKKYFFPCLNNYQSPHFVMCVFFAADDRNAVSEGEWFLCSFGILFSQKHDFRVAGDGEIRCIVLDVGVLR